MRKLASVAVLVAALLAGCGGTPTRGYRVPSAAMLPTLPPGTHVTVELDPKYVPKVGDIVVFHPPAGADSATPMCGNRNQGAGHSQACDMPTAVGESSLTFIKRIVAGPGDTLQIVDGHAMRNGQLEQEPFITPCGPDPSCNFRTSIKLPSDYYFVLGDNRGASDDSRFWGPVRREWIIGKVVNIDRSGVQPTTT